MKFLLDTCVLSEIVKPSPNRGVIRWVETQNPEILAISAVTIGEIQRGISRLPDSRKKTGLAHWLENDLFDWFSGKILPVDETVARAWGMLQAESESQGRTLPVLDALIAATAGVHRLTLVTRNKKDFSVAGIPILNPWD
jgi:predicted nucleic acid-binding protein